MSSLIGIILLGIGVAFNFFGCLGLIRFPDIYNRLQAGTKCVTFGTIFMLIGVLVLSGFHPLGLKAILCLGLGPVGVAFFTWDYGVKRGNIKVLGAFSYAAPLLSTLLLIGFGRAEPSWTIALACAFIVGGAVLAAGDFLK